MDRDTYVTGLRRQLALHAHDPSTEQCPRCRRSYCPPYAEAVALLADAGGDPGAVEVRAL